MAIMPASLGIREFSSGISVRVTESSQVWRALAILATGTFFLYLVFHSRSDSKEYLYVIGGICGLVIVRGVLSALRGTAVELRVTNLDFVSSGHAPEDYRQSTIARADIYNLEYREASGGGDFPELPEGLFVEHHRVGPGPGTTSTCVLPHLDKTQTAQVMEAIYRRFPDTGRLPSTGAFEPYLISLNLNASDRSERA
jgi:hypothetical protein